MAQDETQKPVESTTTVVPAKEVSVPVTTEKTAEAPAPEMKMVSEKEAPVPVSEPEVTAEKLEEITTGKVIVQTESFKEQGYLASELLEAEKNALAEFKEMVREALNKGEFTAPVETKAAAPVTIETKKEETVETKPAAPVTTETKKEEKPASVETNAAALVTTDTKQEEKPSPVQTEPAPSVTTETKKEEQSAPVETKAAAPVTIETIPAVPVTLTTETKKEEEGTKTIEAIQESIVSTTLPETAAPVEPEEVSIWGIPLLQDERSDVVLLKFLRARDFKAKEAFTMLKNTVQWRKENSIDDLAAEGSEFEKMVFAHGVDKQGHVVIYSSYGEFQNKEMFSDKEKLNEFLKWRIQFQEKCVRSLDFSPEGKSSFVFVSDFRNAPGLGKRALWQFIRRAVKQFEDNYPEFVAKELFINVPWWYIPYYKTFGSIVTSAKTRSKMVLAGPSKSAETIFKYVAPEVVPVKYGGLSKESPFTVKDEVTRAVVKSFAKHTIALPASEGCTLSWELRVLGADVSYGAQFEPANEASYTMIVSKNRKIGLTDEPVITDSFKVGEAGKIVITINNQTFKKKKVIYRFKTQA